MAYAAQYCTYKRILTVDDDIAILLALKRRLELAGLTVLTARDGPEALTIASKRVDAITLDLNLPGSMDGLAIAQALQRDPATARIPVIFVTGAADADFRVKCETAGGDFFLSKPYDGEVLLRLLDGIFARDELGQMQRISSMKRRQPVEGPARQEV